MSNFSLKILKLRLGKNVTEPFNFYISAGQNWFIRSSSDGNIQNLFDWIEGNKYSENSILEYNDDHVSCQGHILVKKYFEIVRFRLLKNESEGFYYQQRYHATENDNIVTLKEFLGEINDPFYEHLTGEFGLKSLLDESVNMLSSGEFRKACIFRAAMCKPRIIFIEEPYIGIDKEGKDKIDALLEYLSSEHTAIVIASTGKYIPSFITDILHLHQDKVIFSGKKNLYTSLVEKISTNFSFGFSNKPDEKYINAFELKNLTLKYGEHIVLKNINWKVLKGEKWLLSGKNGAGKSMLLSLLYADNPQVYSNEVYLFDKKRGTGETIWDIKDRISFYSYEMYRYFNKFLTVDETIRYLVMQNPYRKREFLKEDVDLKESLLDYFDIHGSNQTILSELAPEYQRLVLMIAGFIKNGPLLILDEPFQGFDEKLTGKMLQLIDNYATAKTFIMVTHNFEEVPLCIQRKFHLQNGEGKEVEL